MPLKSCRLHREKNTYLKFVRPFVRATSKIKRCWDGQVTELEEEKGSTVRSVQIQEEQKLVSTVGLSAVEKKTKLLCAVGNQIDAHPAMFQNLLQALRKQPPLKEVVDDLEGIYKDYGRWGLVSASRRD